MRGAQLGEVRMVLNGTVLAAVPLLASETVRRDDFAARWQRYVRQWPLVMAP